MEGTTTRKSFGGGSARDLLSTRRGSVIVAAVTALVAGILILAFVASRDDDGIVGGGGTGRVLVAKSLIPKGSTGDVVASQALAVATTLDNDQIKEGAIADPATLSGRVAAEDVYPGQQITAADFTSTDVGVAAKLSGSDRAISVPVGGSNGLVGTVRTGDRVDIYYSAGVGGNNSNNQASSALIRPLLRDVLVLGAPSGGDGGATGGGNEGANIILRAADHDAARLAYAADNGKIWVVLRAAAGARDDDPETVTGQDLVRGPVTDQGGK